MVVSRSPLSTVGPMVPIDGISPDEAAFGHTPHVARFGSTWPGHPRGSCGVDNMRTECKHLRVVGEGEMAAIKQLVDRLKQDYPDVSPDTIVTVVHQYHARFEGRPVRDFVPLFVEKGAKRELLQISI